MKRKQYYIYIIVAAIIIFLGFTYFYLSISKTKLIDESVSIQENNYQEKNIQTSDLSRGENTIINDISSKNTNPDNIKVSLVVNNINYQALVKNGSSVFETMKYLKDNNINQNKFDFSYTHNEVLGNFITEINSVKGTPGNYWIYYVNGQKASVGVSNYILKDGDIISWKQESF